MCSIQMASDTLPPSKKREKIAIKPGFHLVDWMRLTQVSDVAGRKGAALRRISIEEVREHRSKFDCWTVYNKKVYNITHYMEYHPGGQSTLMAAAGRDCTKDFNKYHSWINCDSIIGKCCVGSLMEEEEIIQEGDENEDENDEGKRDKEKKDEEKRGENDENGEKEEKVK